MTCYHIIECYYISNLFKITQPYNDMLSLHKLISGHAHTFIDNNLG